MTLVDEYRKQYAWRDWAKALSLCPVSSGQRVLDLGCGPGDIAAEFFNRGAIVTGIDGNSELLAAAKERCPQCTFEKQDLNVLNLSPETFDGLWCCFTAAYFTDFETTFAGWLPFLKKNALVCVIEIDDLLGHEPLSENTRRNIQEFYKDALDGGRYDFRAGQRIQGILKKNGFQVVTVDLDDRELSFSGPAGPTVLQAWMDRLNRMGGLKAYFKDAFVPFTNEFIQSISSKNHRSLCKVVCCVGTKK